MAFSLAAIAKLAGVLIPYPAVHARRVPPIIDAFKALPPPQQFSEPDEIEAELSPGEWAEFDGLHVHMTAKGQVRHYGHGPIPETVRPAADLAGDYVAHLRAELFVAADGPTTPDAAYLGFQEWCGDFGYVPVPKTIFLESLAAIPGVTMQFVLPPNKDTSSILSGFKTDDEVLRQASVLCKRLGLSKAEVSQRMRKAEAAGYITVERKGRDAIIRMVKDRTARIEISAEAPETVLELARAA